MKKRVDFLILLMGLILCSNTVCCLKEKNERISEILESEKKIEGNNALVELPEVQKKKIDLLQGDLKKIEKAVNEIVAKTSNQRQLYGRLGDRYMELGWLKEAYKAYRNALEINAEDEVLHYKAAVCCAAYSKKELPLIDKELNFERAVFHYKRAIDLRSDYKEAIIALAILYHFEMKMPVEAMELVLKGMGEDRRLSPQLFLLRSNIALYFEKYRAANGADYPRSKELLARCGKSSWGEIVTGDLQNVVDRFNGVKDPEIQEMVFTALRMKDHQVGDGGK